MCVCVTKPAWCSARGPGARAGGMKLKYSIHGGEGEGGRGGWREKVGGGGGGDGGRVGETKDNRDEGEKEDLMTGGTASLQSGGAKQKGNVLGQIENVPCINDAWPSAFFCMCVKEEEEEDEERSDTKENVAAPPPPLREKPARLTLTTCDSYIIMRVDSPRGQA